MNPIYPCCFSIGAVDVELSWIRSHVKCGCFCFISRNLSFDLCHRGIERFLFLSGHSTLICIIMSCGLEPCKIAFYCCIDVLHWVKTWFSNIYFFRVALHWKKAGQQLQAYFHTLHYENEWILICVRSGLNWTGFLTGGSSQGQNGSRFMTGLSSEYWMFLFLETVLVPL